MSTLYHIYFSFVNRNESKAGAEQHAAHTPRKRWRCTSEAIILGTLGILVRFKRIRHFPFGYAQ